MTTLLVSVVILVLTTILVIFVSRAALMEQRMSANEIRHKQAFEAAQAGLDQAMVFMRTAPQGIDKNNDNVADAGPTATLSNGSTYFVAFCQPGTAIPACPDAPGYVACTAPALSNFNTPVVASCGWSDDNIARQMVRQGMGSVSAMSRAPTNPLTSGAGVNVSGSANVVNYFNNLTVWSGGTLSSIGNAGKTFIRNPTVSPPAAGTVPPGEPNSCSTSTDYVCVTDKNTTGPDVIDNDPTLASLSGDQMFLNYFGRTLNEYKTQVASQVINAANVDSIAGTLGQSIVINGNTTFPNATIGSRERPVVLIVDGNVSFQGTPTIYGTLYVTGDVTGGGNPRVQGSMVVKGSVAPTGSVDIIYDPFVTSTAATTTGIVGWIPGTWRDWR
ncbi:pilus assembly PilX family protein [Hydrogenophaga aquatica]